MSLNSGIYQIRNLVNNHIYIGQSHNIKNRMATHISDLNMDKHHSRYLQRAYNKYGKDNFVFEILLYCETFELTRYEQFFVDTKNPEYNIRKKCVTSNLGVSFTDEVKAKLSEIHKGEKHSQAHIEKTGAALLNQSEESKKKRADSNRGKKRSEEFRERLSRLNTGKKASKETREKQSNSAKNRKKSDKPRKKFSKEYIQSMSASRKIGISGYKWVGSRGDGTYSVTIPFDGKRIYLGTFSDPKIANEAIQKYFKDHSC